MGSQILPQREHHRGECLGQGGALGQGEAHGVSAGRQAAWVSLFSAGHRSSSGNRLTVQLTSQINSSVNGDLVEDQQEEQKPNRLG